MRGVGTYRIGTTHRLGQTARSHVREKPDRLPGVPCGRRETTLRFEPCPIQGIEILKQGLAIVLGKGSADDRAQEPRSPRGVRHDQASAVTMLSPSHRRTKR